MNGRSGASFWPCCFFSGLAGFALLLVLRLQLLGVNGAQRELLAVLLGPLDVLLDGDFVVGLRDDVQGLVSTAATWLDLGDDDGMLAEPLGLRAGDGAAILHREAEEVVATAARLVRAHVEQLAGRDVGH